MPFTQEKSVLTAAVTLVAHHPLRVKAWPVLIHPVNRPPAHQRLEHARLVPAPGGSHERNRATVALDVHVPNRPRLRTNSRRSPSLRQWRAGARRRRCHRCNVAQVKLAFHFDFTMQLAKDAISDTRLAPAGEVRPDALSRPEPLRRITPGRTGAVHSQDVFHN